MVLAMPPKIRRETQTQWNRLLSPLNFCCLSWLPASRVIELSNEEAALRHRLELKVERTLYKVAVGLSWTIANPPQPIPGWSAYGRQAKVEEASKDAL